MDGYSHGRRVRTALSVMRGQKARLREVREGKYLCHVIYKT